MRLLIALAFVTGLAAQCPSPYGYQRSITVNSAQVTGTLTDFPMLVTGSSFGTSLKTVANGGRVQNANGYDVIFVNGAGTTLSFELVGHGGGATTYSATTGDGEWWVKVASMATASAVYACYGNAAITTYQGNDTGTWNSAYVAVIHHGTASTLSITDSTGINTPSNTNSSTTGTGKIDGGATFVSASSQNINLGTNAALNPSTALTYMAWYKGTSFTSAFSGIVIKSDGTAYSQSLVTSAGKLAMFVKANGCGGGDSSYNGTGANTLSTGTFYHITMTYDGTAGLVGYVNGGVDGTAAATGSICSNTGSTLEGTLSDGLVDELEISNVARSADWVAAQYNNQNAPASFYAVGSEIPLVGGVWGTWNGKTVGGSSGNVSSWNGGTIGTSTGNIGTYDGLTSPTGGGGSAWDATPICHSFADGNGNATAVTTGTVNCTGATHYFVGLSVFGAGAATASCLYNDGSNHNFTLATAENASTAGNTQAIQYAQGITGGGSVFVTCTTNFGSIYFQGWKIGASTSSLDQESTNAVQEGGTPPSLTPTQNDTLVLLMASSEAAGTNNVATTTPAFTFVDKRDFNGSVSEGGTMGYYVISGGSGISFSPASFTNSGNSGGGKMANFKHP